MDTQREKNVGFSFRKRIRLMKGVHLNVGKKGTSVSVGGKGFSMTRGAGRSSVSVGLPGSGLSYRKTRRDGLAATEDVVAEERPYDGGAGYAVGRQIAERGLIATLAGWSLRGIAVFLGLTALVNTLASFGDESVAASGVTAILLGLAAVACWRGARRLLTT